jgi:hypothetical protein
MLSRKVDECKLLDDGAATLIDFGVAKLSSVIDDPHPPSLYGTPGYQAGGSLRISTPPDEPSPRVCMSIHPEGKSCWHVRSRF